MNLRNIDGASRDALSSLSNRSFGNRALSTRSGAASGRNTRANAPETGSSQTANVPSRGAFFEMMLSAQPSSSAAQKPAIPKHVSAAASPTAARILSTDENSSVRGGSLVSTIRNANSDPSTPSFGTSGTPDAPPPPAQTPVEAINSLLGKLGYDPANFNARVTSATISVPGLSYEYPLLEVTVNGERVGFHLPSAMKDPRITAANISSMLGRPIMDLSVFA